MQDIVYHTKPIMYGMLSAQLFTLTSLMLTYKRLVLAEESPLALLSFLFDVFGLVRVSMSEVFDPEGQVSIRKKNSCGNSRLMILCPREEVLSVAMLFPFETGCFHGTDPE